MTPIQDQWRDTLERAHREAQVKRFEFTEEEQEEVEEQPQGMHS